MKPVFCKARNADRAGPRPFDETSTFFIPASTAFCSVLRRDLRGESCALAGAFETSTRLLDHHGMPALS